MLSAQTACCSKCTGMQQLVRTACRIHVDLLRLQAVGAVDAQSKALATSGGCCSNCVHAWGHAQTAGMGTCTCTHCMRKGQDRASEVTASAAGARCCCAQHQKSRSCAAAHGIVRLSQCCRHPVLHRFARRLNAVCCRAQMHAPAHRGSVQGGRWGGKRARNTLIHARCLWRWLCERLAC